MVKKGTRTMPNYLPGISATPLLGDEAQLSKNLSAAYTSEGDDTPVMLSGEDAQSERRKL